LNSANKYQPYQGYGYTQPWRRRIYSYGQPGYGRRIRIRSDWHYDYRPWRFDTGEVVAYFRAADRRWPFWRRPKDSGGSVYEKRLAHRAFRRLAKQAIQRELDGEEVSHNFRYCSAERCLD
jgi:hypothetical protein